MLFVHNNFVLNIYVKIYIEEHGKGNKVVLIWFVLVLKNEFVNCFWFQLCQGSTVLSINLIHSKTHQVLSMEQKQWNKN